MKKKNSFIHRTFVNNANMFCRVRNGRRSAADTNRNNLVQAR